MVDKVPPLRPKAAYKPSASPRVPESLGLPPGLAKRDKLPPGLAKRTVLPPGLAKRVTSGVGVAAQAMRARPFQPSPPGGAPGKMGYAGYLAKAGGAKPGPRPTARAPRPEPASPLVPGGLSREMIRRAAQPDQSNKNPLKRLLRGK